MDIFSISVLLVEAEDGDSITRELLSEQTTFTSEWVASYDAALTLIGRSQHDIYLFNYALGRYNGLDLLKEATLRGCQVPIILLIEPGVEVETEALQAGAADCLIKGQFDSRLLQRSICYAIERQKILRSLKESESRLESILSLRQEVV